MDGSASVESDSGSTHKFPYRLDTVRAMADCCRSKLGVEITDTDIAAG